ncbi:MAG: glycerophosphodiester phosphodiesterase family protein, partial [Victivallales bacterium]|nr:glycerophosphodiester phosphodiesterase family protein [Victivallales bacterium]
MRTFIANGITGHRGNAADFPENTLAAFRDAVELGVDWIELDVRRSRDGRLMVIHDSDTERTCGVHCSIADTDSCELRRLNASYGYNRDHGAAASPAVIPFLEEVLDIIGSANVRVSIQPKTDCVEQICSLVKSRKLSEYAGFNDGCLDIIRKAKKLLPEAIIFYDLSRREDMQPALRAALKYGFSGIVQFRPQLAEEDVKMIRSAGL